ncbi:MAG: hypothetical protein FWC55_02625, partial [Firmicutes bacterium]|nr:hypothetical protein [Bacillota bacterium]
RPENMPVGTNQRFFVDAFPCLRLFFGGKCQTQDKYFTGGAETPNASTAFPAAGCDDFNRDSYKPSAGGYGSGNGNRIQPSISSIN